MYFQMGGNPGDGSTLPRTNGARAAAAVAAAVALAKLQGAEVIAVALAAGESKVQDIKMAGGQ